MGASVAKTIDELGALEAAGVSQHMADIASSSPTTLWVSPGREPIAALIAICGDFLPAGKLSIRDASSWGEMAGGIGPCFQNVAATFVNLECCLDVGNLCPRTLNGLGDIVCAPVESLDYLAAIRTVAVSMANNHSFDFGEAGVERSRIAVLRHSLIPLGAGRTLRESPEVFVWSGPHGIRVGFWAAATATLDPATSQKVGVEPATIARARQALAELKCRGAGLSIALLHAGCLRTSRPDPEQVQLMDSIAKSGFDIVAASHSHRISGYSRLRENDIAPSFCFYGLGSLVSGYAACPLEKEGLVVVVGLNRRGQVASLELNPVVLDDTGFGTMPSPQMKQEILARFDSLSAELAGGFYEHRFYRDISQGLLRLYVRDVKAAYRTEGIRGLARKTSRVRARHVRRVVRGILG